MRWRSTRSSQMSEPIELRLPYPPSVNRYWRVWRNRAVKSPTAKKFAREVREVVAKGGWPRVSGQVRVTVELSPEKGRKPDIDNAAKALLDALVDSGVMEDDRDVEALSMWRSHDERGDCLVTLEVIE